MPRGTAEIELVLAIPLLLVLMFLALNIMYLHNARQLVFSRTTAEVHRDAAEYNLQPDLDIALPTEIFRVNVRPTYEIPSVRSIRSLPNVIYMARDEQTVRFRLGNNQGVFDTATVHEKSALVGPSWTYGSASFIPGLDVMNVRRWYTDLSRYATGGFDRELRLAGD